MIRIGRVDSGVGINVFVVPTMDGIAKPFECADGTIAATPHTRRVLGNAIIVATMNGMDCRDSGPFRIVRL